MTTYKLVSTVRFVNASGDEAKYEIYFDPISTDYHASVYYLDKVQSVSKNTLLVWHRVPHTINCLPGSSIEQLEDSCLNHFEGR